MKAIYFLAIVFTIVIQSNNSFSQKPGFLKIKFDVTDSVKTFIDNPTITVYEEGKEINKLNTNPCSLTLDLNKTYLLEVSANTHNTKTIMFDTNVPETDLVYKYNFRVGLLHRIITEKSLTKVCYDEKVKAFDFCEK